MLKTKEKNQFKVDRWVPPQGPAAGGFRAVNF
jgi:hypothetical protein